MNRVARSIGAVVGVMAAAGLAACSSAPKGSVSKKELRDIKASAQTVAPGQPKADVLAKYEGANLVRLSSTQVDGAAIEEWKSEAFTDSDHGRDLSVQFLYFRNDILVDTSDTRLDYRGDSELMKRWAAGAE